MKTVAGEFGVGEVGVKLDNTNYPGQQKGPTGRQNLIIQLQIPQVQQRSDLSTAYSERIENIKNDEYDWVVSLSLKRKKRIHTRV